MLLNAQNPMDYTKEEFKTKSKKELIEIAKELLKEKHPEIILNLNNFNSRAWSNEFGTTKVVFSRAIRYVSNEIEAIQYDIIINLDTKEIIPFDNPDMLFYTSSKKADKVIEGLKEKGLLPKTNQPDTEYTITENAEYYLISCFDDLHSIDKQLISTIENPFLSKTIVNKKTEETLFFKGINPYYFLSQISFNHYYEESLYTVLKEENIVNQARSTKGGRDSSKSISFSDKPENKRSEIIKIATSILKEKQPNIKINPIDFEIVILGNYKDIIVKYRRYIRFKNRNQKTVFDLAVNIITKEIFPFNTSKNSFYTPSLADEKAIKIIQHTIPLKFNPDLEHTISENDNYFFITSISEKSIKKYFINKKNNERILIDESNNLRINNREDLTLQEHYNRMNSPFVVESENNKQLTDMALAILKEEQFIPINLDDYSIKVQASKNEVQVNFTRLIKFIPLRHKENSKLEYNLKVSLVDKTVAQKLAQFYFPTKDESITIELIKTKLIDFSALFADSYLKGFENTHYPIEIIEEKDFFTIETSEVSNFKEGTHKQYRMDKRTKTIEVVLTPTYFYPTPAMRPIPLKEVKD